MKRILFFLIIIVIVQFAFSQNTNEELFNKSVDYINWQIVWAYMKDYTSKHPEDTAEVYGYNNFISNFSTKFNINNPPPYEILSKFLCENSYNSAKIKISDKIIKFNEDYQPNWNKEDVIDYLIKKINDPNGVLKSYSNNEYRAGVCKQQAAGFKTN